MKPTQERVQELAAYANAQCVDLFYERACKYDHESDVIAAAITTALSERDAEWRAKLEAAEARAALAWDLLKAPSYDDDDGDGAGGHREVLTAYAGWDQQRNELLEATPEELREWNDHCRRLDRERMQAERQRDELRAILSEVLDGVEPTFPGHETILRARALLAAHPAEPAVERESLQQRVAAWARKTFPGATDHGRLTHLAREVAELQEAPGDASEMADVYLILLHHADAHGVTLDDAAEAKFAEVQTREWGEPDADGVVEHLRTRSHDGAVERDNARAVMPYRTWECKIGAAKRLPFGADAAMRHAVETVYQQITGEAPDYTFSGWGGSLEPEELAVVEDREPTREAMLANAARLERKASEIRAYHAEQAATEEPQR